MKRHALNVVAVLVLALVAPTLLHAQETQVPLDEDGQLLEVDRALARRLGLFLDRHPDLQVVRLYQEGTDRYVFEVTFQRDGRAARTRIPMTSREVLELRQTVSAALAANAPDITLDQDGRFLLLGATTALGLAYYGWAVPHVLGIESGRGILAGYMLTAGASFVAPYLYTRDRPVTYGMANAGFWGATRGISHGLLLAHLVDPTPAARTANGLSTAMSLAEGLAGYTWAGRAGMSAGDAHTIGSFGDYGMALAGFAMLTAQPAEEQVVYGSLLAGAAAGLAAGSARARRLPHTWGDVEIQRTAFTVGAANGAVLWDVVFGENASDDQIRLISPLLAGGSIGGMLLADRALQDHDFSAGQAILVDLGTVAGGLLGIGLAVLLKPDDANDDTGVLVLGALGADLGLLATYASLSDDARKRADTRTGRTADRLDLQLNPAALATLHPGLDLVPSDRPLPLLSVHYRF